jgi:PAS domain S-box-containing protein
LQATLARLEKSHADLLSILSRLRVGTVLLDASGRILFLSQACERILGKDQGQVLGRAWTAVFPLPQATQMRLQTMLQRRAQDRARISTQLEATNGRHYWMEVDIQDDPRDSKRKIIFLYDLSEVEDLRRLLHEKTQFQGMVGNSEAMLAVYRDIHTLAQVNSTVLIEGETGTGKELVAREIHAASPRHEGPFVALNCAGLTDSLLASQLFGHKRGAFTGAVADHHGVFEAANGGTLFLDEIGDVSPLVQTSLLRVLQEREIVRVGESRPRTIDVRILAATNRDLQEAVAQGTFRADLFYRIRVARLRLPPLRERLQDLHLLVSAFLGQFRLAMGKPVETVSQEAMRLLQAYSWPGNVRELRSALEFGVIRCRGAVMKPEDLPAEIGDAEPSPGEFVASGDGRQRLLAALEQSGGNRTAAARLLGMSRATFYRRLADFGISRDS